MVAKYLRSFFVLMVLAGRVGLSNGRISQIILRTFGPVRVLGIDEAQWGGPKAFGKPDPEVGPNR